LPSIVTVPTAEEAPVSNKPLATYREHTLLNKQTVQLYADKIELHGSHDISTDFEWSCPLSSLAPTFNRGRTRGPFFSLGIAALLIWLLLWVLLPTPSGAAVYSVKWTFFYVLPLSFGLIIAAAWRKLRYVVVMSADGTPLFTLTESPQREGAFDHFTALLVERIRECGLAPRHESPASQSQTTPN
jgi:hypothetical protein